MKGNSNQFNTMTMLAQDFYIPKEATNANFTTGSDPRNKRPKFIMNAQAFMVCLVTLIILG